MNTARWALVVMLASGLQTAASGETYTPGQKTSNDFGSFARPFLASHCLDCHGSEEPAGNLSLLDLGPVDEGNSGTWRRVWAQVTLKEMPPKDAEHPTVVHRLQFSDWIVSELTRVMRDKGGFRAHLDPNKGNFVDHNLLFGPLPENIKLAPTSSLARIWRVTPQEHITRLNELINTESKYDPKKPGQTIGIGVCRLAYKDRNGMIWFATSTGGLNILSYLNGEVTIRPYEFNSILKATSKDYISSIYHDNEGNYWMGTLGSGLVKWDVKSKKVISFNKSDGLPNDVIYGVISDDSGVLWLSTNKGLCSFGKSGKRVKNYTEVNGLMSNEFNLGAFMKTKKGELYFGGI